MPRTQDGRCRTDGVRWAPVAVPNGHCGTCRTLTYKDPYNRAHTVIVTTQSHLHLNYATDIASNKRRCRMQRQGVGNVRCETRGFITNRIRRERGWKGEDGFLLDCTSQWNRSFRDSAIQNHVLERVEYLCDRNLPVH